MKYSTVWLWITILVGLVCVAYCHGIEFSQDWTINACIFFGSYALLGVSAYVDYRAKRKERMRKAARRMVEGLQDHVANLGNRPWHGLR